MINVKNIAEHINSLYQQIIQIDISKSQDKDKDKQIEDVTTWKFLFQVTRILDLIKNK